MHFIISRIELSEIFAYSTAKLNSNFLGLLINITLKLQFRRAAYKNCDFWKLFQVSVYFKIAFLKSLIKKIITK